MKDKGKGMGIEHAATGVPLEDLPAPPAPTGHPGETLAQPVPADPIAVPAPESDVAPAPVKTAEHWATKHGHLPEQLPVKGKRGGNKVGPVRAINPKTKLYDQARFLLWGGRAAVEMTEQQYLDGVQAATNHEYR